MYIVENVGGELFQRFISASDIDAHLQVIEKEDADEKAKSGAKKDVI